MKDDERYPGVTLRRYFPGRWRVYCEQCGDQLFQITALATYIDDLSLIQEDHLCKGNDDG